MKLFSGAAFLDEKRRDALKSYFLRFQTSDGGFSGRNGDGELYYTGFALRGLFLLGGIENDDFFRKITRFLDEREKPELSAVEWTSLAFSRTLAAWMNGSTPDENGKHRMLKALRAFRCPDGCYATSKKTGYSSTYQTFLTATVMEMTAGEERSPVEEIPVEPILQRQRPDGGFVELEKLRQSGTNPTAAAVGFLVLRGIEPNDREGVVQFLLKRQTEQGGFAAHTRYPVPDLLSSFTALVALSDLKAEKRCELERLRSFVEGMESADGGYFAADWDRQSDVEYTFYGLALESLLASFDSGSP